MILALAGLSRSGKTTLAAELASRLAWPRLGFGRYVEYVAVSQGIGSSFDALQILGQSLVDSDPLAFVQSVFEFGGLSPSDSAILDGLRHVEVLSALEDLIRPSRVIVVLVEVPTEELTRRCEAAGVDSAAVLAAPAEQQVQSHLRGKASLVVDGTQPLAETAKYIIAYMNELA